MPPDDNSNPSPASLDPRKNPPMPPVQREPNGDPTSLAEAKSAQNTMSDYVKQQEDLFYSWLNDQHRAGKSVQVTSDRVEERVPGTKATSSENFNAFTDSGGSTADKWSSLTDTAMQGQLLWDNLQDAKRQLSYGIEDAKQAKAAAGSGGAVKSYMDTEQPKTKEITRQYNDFQDRANELYSLMDAEQKYGMNADDQNIQNMKAQRDLGTAIMPGGYYTKPYMSGSLSSILAPSLPDYVRPDYRLNAAVGLPGPEGFDNPNYDSNGMPMYAAGTDPNKPREIYWPWRNN